MTISGRFEEIDRHLVGAHAVLNQIAAEGKTPAATVLHAAIADFIDCGALHSGSTRYPPLEPLRDPNLLKFRFPTCYRSLPNVQGPSIFMAAMRRFLKFWVGGIFAALSVLSAYAQTPPALGAQPVSSTVNVGAIAMFTVEATGSAPLSYQWNKNGVPIVGATTATLSLPNVLVTDAASYSCIVTNTVGFIRSSTATLTVVPISIVPKITSSPQSTTVTAGYGAVLAVGATGVPAPTYQWFKDSAMILGATGPTLSLIPNLPDAGSYSVTVTNSAGSVTSSTATLTVDSPLVIKTVAGTGSIGYGDGALRSAQFGTIRGIVLDRSGVIYVADESSTTIRKITSTGVSTIAGLSRNFGSADGQGATARFNGPTGIAVDNASNLFVTEQHNYTIRKISPSGAVTTFAGLAGSQGSADGQGSAARFYSPFGITIDATGNLYVSEYHNSTIRKITPAGLVTTFAGLAGSAGRVDGLGTAARLHGPRGMAVDRSGNIYVAEGGGGSSGAVRKITPQGMVTTFAVIPGPRENVDSGPADVAIDSTGNLYVIDRYNPVIRRITPSGVATIVAGFNDREGNVDGTGIDARFKTEGGALAIDEAGNLYIGDTSNFEIRVGLAGLPQIRAQPGPQSVTEGKAATFPVIAQGKAPLAYQWEYNGTPIPGATNATFTIGSVQLSNAGAYTVSISNSASTVRSTSVGLTVLPGNPARLINLSILTSLAIGETLTMGTVLGGSNTSGSPPILVRAAGPSLTPLGVVGALADPRLDLFSGQTPAGTNDNWGGTTALVNAFISVGAFAYSSGSSRDAAIYNPSLRAGTYTVLVSGSGSPSGTVLAEIYEATPASAFILATPRLINISVLKRINAGETLTAGFVIGGAGPKQVLIRAVGPGLVPLGVGATMTDPRLELFSGQTLIDSNNDWGGGGALAAVFTSVGAFSLPEKSADAALLITLSPGNYTAQVSGVGDTGGVALVEVYEVP